MRNEHRSQPHLASVTVHGTSPVVATHSNDRRPDGSYVATQSRKNRIVTWYPFAKRTLKNHRTANAIHLQVTRDSETALGTAAMVPGFHFVGCACQRYGGPWLRLYPKADQPEHRAADGVSEGTALCRSFASYGAASEYVQMYVSHFLLLRSPLGLAPAGARLIGYPAHEVVRFLPSPSASRRVLESVFPECPAAPDAYEFCTPHVSLLL